jgi:hypothetical protein
MAGIGDTVALLLSGNLVIEIILLAAKVGHHGFNGQDLPTPFLKTKALQAKIGVFRAHERPPATATNRLASLSRSQCMVPPRA